MSRIKQSVRRGVRRSEKVQDVYEAYKNRERSVVLKELIPVGGVGAELGVHKGHLTPGLLKWLQPSHLFVVDPWYQLGSTWEWAAGDKSTVGGLRRTAKKIAGELGTGRAELVIADDRDFLSNLADNSLDWVYLDSSHMYEHTLEELELLVRKVRPTGVIAGDDWRSDPNHRHHGVCRAVREFDAANRLDLFFSDDRNQQWAARVRG